MSVAASYIREDDLGIGATGTTWSGLHGYRFALWNLMLKDFKVRYRNMSLGVLWSLINPLVMLGVLVVVFSYIHPQRHTHYFPVFLLIGMVTYNFSALCLPFATNAIIDNASLVKRVIFPRELIPISVVISQLIHVGIQLLLLVFFILIFRVPFALTWLWMPVAYLVMLVFLMGMGFACSALSVVYRDTLYVVESALKVLFWLTPVFYDLTQVKLNLPRPLYYLYILNPMSGCIDAVRAAILRGEHPDPESMGIAAAMAVIALIFGWRLFRKRQPYFADYI